jgi:GNAT superfamily N-acetyltransferase
MDQPAPIDQQIVTRPATLEDLDTLFRFEQGVIAAERPLDPTLKKGDIHYYNLTEMIEAPHIELVVALLGEEIVGSGYARIEDSQHFYQYSQHAYLGFMYVSPAHRGKGVNQKIIEALKQWAIGQNMREMRLEVYKDNLPAIKAYEKVGFTQSLVQMRMGLDK